MDSTKSEQKPQISQTFEIDSLEEIQFGDSEEIVIDSTEIPDIDLNEMLVLYGVLKEEDTPSQIIIFAKKEGANRSFGVLADMGGKDTAGLYITSENTLNTNGLSLFSITHRCPRRSVTNKYDHTETESGSVVKNPQHGRMFCQLFDILMSYNELGH